MDVFLWSKPRRVLRPNNARVAFLVNPNLVAEVFLG